MNREALISDALKTFEGQAQLLKGIKRSWAGRDLPQVEAKDVYVKVLALDVSLFGKCVLAIGQEQGLSATASVDLIADSPFDARHPLLPYLPT